MRPLIVLSVLLGAAGCYTPTLMGAGPDRSSGPRWQAHTSHGGGYARHTSLRATLRFDEYSGYASFNVNRPAHVALFAMRPLGAIEMIYPRWGHGHRGHGFRAGHHTVRTDSRMYHLTRSRSAFGHYDARAPLYIVLIASDRPLDLDALWATGTAAWLNHPSVTWNPFLATERLAREIVRGHGSADWTVAYHVVWPHARFHRRDGRVPRTRVVCPGGPTVWVSTQALHSGWYHCPDRTRRPPAAARPRDVARPAIPRTPPIRTTLPNRPRPTDWRGATPTPPATGGEHGARPVRPAPTTRSTPTVLRPASQARPSREARPPREVRPSREARPSREVRPTSRRPAAKPKPAARPKAESKPRPAPRPRPRPAPRPRPKPGSGGG